MDMSDPYTAVLSFFSAHPFFWGILLFVYIVCLLIIIVRGSFLKTKNAGITTNANEGSASNKTENKTLLYCCLLLILLLVLTK